MIIYNTYIDDDEEVYMWYVITVDCNCNQNIHYYYYVCLSHNFLVGAKQIIIIISKQHSLI